MLINKKKRGLEEAILFFVHVELSVQAVHQIHVYKDEDDENINRALLGKPKANFKSPHSKLVQGGYKQNTKHIRNHKPDEEQNGEVLEVFLPVLLHFLFLFHHQLIENGSANILT
jgi:hypothetical protein